MERNPESKLWRVVKHCKTSKGNIVGYKLQPEDLVKIGRVRFKVREVQSPAYEKQKQRQANRTTKFISIQTKQQTKKTVIRSSNQMTDTENYHNDLQVFHSAIPNYLPSSSNIIIPKGLEMNGEIVVRETSQGSNGLPLCRICLSEE